MVDEVSGHTPVESARPASGDRERIPVQLREGSPRCTPEASSSGASEAGVAFLLSDEDERLVALQAVQALRLVRKAEQSNNPLSPLELGLARGTVEFLRVFLAECEAVLAHLEKPSRPRGTPRSRKRPSQRSGKKT